MLILNSRDFLDSTSTRMGTKRPCAPDCGTDNVPTSTHPFQSRPTKRLRPNTSNPHPAHSGAALNPIKAKIRDVTRLLKRSDDLPPGVRIEKERALAGHRQDLAEAEAEKRRQHMIGKYHMVRFFGQSLNHETRYTVLYSLRFYILIYRYSRAPKSHEKPEEAQCTYR